MASNKAKQQVKIWLKNVFTRSHNSRSDRGKRATAEGEKAMTENGYKSDVYADDFGDNQGGTKKTIMWCLIAVLISIGILVYYHHGKKGASEDIAKTEVLDLDTTVVQVAQVPQQVQEKKKQPVPVQQPVQQKVVTVSKQQAAPAREPEKPATTTTKAESKAELKYAPNGEVLIQKPVYPKNGFGSNQEKENYFSTLEQYRKQQRRISDWKIQHDIE